MSIASQTVNAVVDSAVMNEKESIGRAIGRIASGVFILTTENNGERDGLLASWVSQAAFEPPMLMVAIKRERHILELLRPESKFTLNVLSKKNMDIFKSFVKPFQPGMDRFEGLTVLPGHKAGPVLAASVAYMDCVIRNLIDAGDHVIVVGEIFNGAVLNAEAEPMVHLRNNGFQY